MIIDPIVAVENLTVMFNDFCAVNNISFSVAKGEIFGFLGANGAGKTATIRILCGLLYPTKGSIKVAGVTFNKPGYEKAVKLKVGYMSQKFTLYNDLTVEENLSFVTSLRNIDKKTCIKRRDEILNFIAFTQPLNSFVKDLPGGIKQQVALAAAILHDPEIIFLDEPTAGVTPAMRFKFWELIKRLARQGKAIFVTTHYMDEAEQCERIALMRTGKIMAIDTTSNLKKIAFPQKLYEYTPKGKISYTQLQDLRKRKEFAYFEPFSSKFHAAFQDDFQDKETVLKKELEVDFVAKEIVPTLEDVFLRVTDSN